MRTIVHILTVTTFLVYSGVALLGQKAAPHFQPGEWEIDSANTVAGGRTVSSQTRICAREQMDFWKVAQVGLSCKPPKTHPVKDGIRVRVHCVYSKGPLHSEIRSDVIESFSDGGNSFTAVGSTTTDTVYQGVQPKQTSAQLQTAAHRVGECH